MVQRLYDARNALAHGMHAGSAKHRTRDAVERLFQEGIELLRCLGSSRKDLRSEGVIAKQIQVGMRLEATWHCACTVRGNAQALARLAAKFEY
jgi:hypothetical protein